MRTERESRTLLATAFGVAGAAFAALCAPSYEGRYGWMVRDVTDVRIVLGLSAVLVLLSVTLGAIAAPRLLAPGPRPWTFQRVGAWMTVLACAYAAPSIWSARALRFSARGAGIMTAWSILVWFAIVVSAAIGAARFARARPRSLVGDAERHSVFLFVTGLSVMGLLARIPERGGKALLAHPPTWFVLFAVLVQGAILSKNVYALVQLWRLKDAPPTDATPGDMVVTDLGLGTQRWVLGTVPSSYRSPETRAIGLGDRTEARNALLHHVIGAAVAFLVAASIAAFHISR